MSGERAERVRDSIVRESQLRNDSDMHNVECTYLRTYVLRVGRL